MRRHPFYLLTVFCLTIGAVKALPGDANGTEEEQPSQDAGQSSTKTDVPTAEQILGKLLGMKPKSPDQTQAQVEATAPQTFTSAILPPGSTSLARSPLKQTVMSNVPLTPTGTRSMPTPQAEDNTGMVAQMPYGAQQPPLPPRRRHRHRYRDEDDENDEDEGGESEPAPGDEDEDDDRNPADDEYHDSRQVLGRGRGRGRGGIGGGRGRGLGGQFRRREGGCGCVCWKGIKPHVEWVRVPVCYHPCGVCCPKHEEQPSCACICHPCCHCCHHCCHSCCHPCCHCCHCCGHCCRRNKTLWRPPIAPHKSTHPKPQKEIKKKLKTAV